MTILLLAGTAEARRIAEGLAELGVPAVASLAGATRAPASLALETRVGGFGGAGEFGAFLETSGIRAVIDATHPFAHRISARTAAVCAARGLPCLQVLRPAWQPQAGDAWTEVAEPENAAEVVPMGATVLLATGRQMLERFAGLAGRRLICRVVDPPGMPFPFEGGDYVVGRPPFSIEDEVRLLRGLDVDWLVVKNAGGAGGAAKLGAARELKLPVAMIRRPPNAGAPVVETPEAALEWAGQL